MFHAFIRIFNTIWRDDAVRTRVWIFFNLTHRHTISHEFMSQFTKLCTDLEEPVVLVGNSNLVTSPFTGNSPSSSEERIFSLIE